MTAARSILLTLLLAAVPSVAAGQINAAAFRPAEHPSDLWGVKTTTVSKGFAPGWGVVAHWGRDPLVFEGDVDGQLVKDRLVQDQVGIELLASIALWDHLDLAIAVPMFVVASGGSRLLDGVDDPDGFSVGDVRLALKAAALRHEERGFGIGADLTASFPTARDGSFTGDDAYTVTALLLFEVNVGGALGALNVGWRVRSEDAVLDTLRVGNELVLALGTSVPVWGGLDVAGELQAATAASAPFAPGESSQLEGRLGVRYHLGDGFLVECGGGASFLEGYGNVAGRVFGGLRWDGQVAQEPVEIVAGGVR